MQAAKPRDALRGRAQHQVIGVGEHDIGAGIPHFMPVDALHGAKRTDRHERGRADRAMRAFSTTPCRALPSVLMRRKGEGHDLVRGHDLNYTFLRV